MTQTAPPPPQSATPPRPSDAEPPEENDRANGGRRPWVLGLGIAIALIVLALGARAVWFAVTHVSTDDAQVDGHITPISPRISGYVVGIRVRDNQQVRAGDTLVVLDDRDLRARLAQADADLAALMAAVGSRGRVGQAVAQLDQARAAAAAAEATVTQAAANAEKARNDLERYRALSVRNIVSRQTLDGAEAAARAGDAQLTAAQRNATAAEEQVTAAGAALTGSEARVAAARAVRDIAALQLSYTVVTAPVSGVVSKKSVEIGQLVQAGQPLMSVVPLEDVWVVANFKETQVAAIEPGAPAVIKADAYAGRIFTGTVESLSPATGAKFSLLPPDNATGNFTKVVQRIPVRIRIESQTDTLHPLRPGMSVDVTISRK
ncbi:MAG TPA: HlyD family secretion protein [Gemmatimonadales bacterium]|nr:HlyD family secretion protein [Gemmatimonadales bacterium]